MNRSQKPDREQRTTSIEDPKAALPVGNVEWPALVKEMMSLNASGQYNLGFTAASLRPELARIIAEAYLDARDWELARRRVLESNALQAKSPSSGRRMESELRQRLVKLTEEELVILAKSTAEDRAAIAWLAVCKHAPFAFGFATEVLREKLEARDLVLRLSDYETYLEMKSAIHPELGALSNLSKNKIRQVLLRMLSEVGILKKSSGLGSIERPVLSLQVRQAIRSDNPSWLAGFLVPYEEIVSA